MDSVEFSNEILDYVLRFCERECVMIINESLKFIKSVDFF